MAEPKGPIVLLCAFDASDVLRALEVDADDALKVAFDAAKKGLVGTHGWISAAWQKNPLLLGYSAPIKLGWSSIDMPAGTRLVDSAAVPAGEIQIITTISYLYSGAIPTNVDVGYRSGAADYGLWSDVAPFLDIWHARQGFWLLSEDDTIRLSVIGATLNDDIYGRAVGFRVDLDQ